MGPDLVVLDAVLLGVLGEHPAAARDRYEEFAEKWGKPYPAITTLWEGAWAEFIPFLDYDVEIRKVI